VGSSISPWPEVTVSTGHGLPFPGPTLWDWCLDTAKAGLCFLPQMHCRFYLQRLRFIPYRTYSAWDANHFHCHPKAHFCIPYLGHVGHVGHDYPLGTNSWNTSAVTSATLPRCSSKTSAKCVGRRQVMLFKRNIFSSQLCNFLLRLKTNRWNLSDGKLTAKSSFVSIRYVLSPLRKSTEPCLQQIAIESVNDSTCAWEVVQMFGSCQIAGDRCQSQFLSQESNVL
jgi:hypothetical protein